jgi:hypothetical protein
VRDDILARIRSVDWTDKSEAAISSQLITPVLHLLGYGEHTLHKFVEQRSYPLKDPTVSKGSRRVKLDYQPSVYEEGLWVMEAKGTDAKVTPKTLGQVRDYTIHPEIRAALMVTVDAAGFRVFDPWDEYWAEPLVTVAVNDVPDRIDELRAVLGVDRVADFVRKRHFDHLRRALSASLEFGVLTDAEREFRGLIREARDAIDTKRSEIHRQARADAEALHERVLKNSGIWGVAQHNNTPWIGASREWKDFATAVLSQDERQRPTQIMQVWPAIEAVFRNRVPDGAPLRRPLWWLHVVVLGGCIQLRGQPSCEPYATDTARQALRDCLLEFPDDPVAAASWRFQRVAIPRTARIAALAPLEELSTEARARLSPEDRIRYRLEPSWFFMHSVTNTMLRLLSSINPWTTDGLDRRAAEVAEALGRLPVPDREWPGPMGDAWLRSWADVDPLLMCSLAAVNENPAGDDLIDNEIRAVIRAAASSERELLRRPAAPLAERLGL